MKRKLVAALACRVQGSRLYGKPLQNLAPDYMILEHILACIDATSEIETAVLGVSEGTENEPFVRLAGQRGIGHIIGGQKDVLMRLIQCGQAAGASDIFRITSECPFTAWELLPEAWSRHLKEDNEITAADGICEGTGFEIYRLGALERAWQRAAEDERSEYANAYPRRHQDEFRIGVVQGAPPLDRMDIRLTVDYPEDLVLCRHIYADLKYLGPRIPLADIVAYCDTHPDLYSLVKPFNVPGTVWLGAGEKTEIASVVQ